MKTFGIVKGSTIQALMDEDPSSVIEVVRGAYLAHREGCTVNPDSYFLKFPDRQRDRIIALPAAITGEGAVAGIKWISSFPGNIERGAPRASAVLILNDLADGVPFALLEASAISAARTAASAVLGCLWLNEGRRSAARVAFVGAGIIARTVMDMFHADGWAFGSLGVFDLCTGYADSFAAHATDTGFADEAVRHGALGDALDADVVVLTTTASTPYILPPRSFRASQIVLNVSLRDIDPTLILQAWNIVDDVDHCLKADTSPHLAERLCGDRNFVAGTLADLMIGTIAPDRTKPLIFSPFGMGILDLALGRSLYAQAQARHEVQEVPDFFAHTARW